MKASTLNPIKSTSNGIIFAFGDTIDNKGFTTFGNSLASFLLNGIYLSHILGKTFRRRFPTVRCTMGYYVRDFKIKLNLASLFKQHLKLERSYFSNALWRITIGKILLQGSTRLEINKAVSYRALNY
jgi:hypothetical protein